MTASVFGVFPSAMNQALPCLDLRGVVDAVGQVQNERGEVHSANAAAAWPGNLQHDGGITQSAFQYLRHCGQHADVKVNGGAFCLRCKASGAAAKQMRQPEPQRRLQIL